jgi:hypothetical protein
LFFILLEKPFMQKKFPMPDWGRAAIQRLRKLAGGTAVVFLMVLPASVFAQTDSLSAKLSVPKGDSLMEIPPILTLKLKPISILCDMAVGNAHEIKAKQLDMAKQALAVSVQRRSWAELLSVNVSGLYGNASALDANSDAFGTRYVLTARKQTGYNLSVAMKITGGDVLTRGQKTEMLRIQGQRLMEEHDGLKAEIRTAVIMMYCQLDLSIKVVRAKIDAVESSRLALTVAEKYFREGNLPLGEFSTINTVYNNAREQLLVAQADAQKQVLLLREFVGADIWER